MWQQHLKVCLGFLLFIIPVAIADNSMLKGSAGWISVDWRGLFIHAYLLFLFVHLSLSTLAIKLFPLPGVIIIHFFSVIISIAAIYAGFAIYVDVENKRFRAYEADLLTLRKPFINTIELKSWYYSPNADSATEIIVNVITHESGRFTVHVAGFNNEIERYFIDADHEQLQVTKGERFTYHIPLNRDLDFGVVMKTGLPKYVEITTHLFGDLTGSAGMDIIKIFKNDPGVVDDGVYFYGELPPPTVNKQEY